MTTRRKTKKDPMKQPITNGTLLWVGFIVCFPMSLLGVAIFLLIKCFEGPSAAEREQARIKENEELQAMYARHRKNREEEADWD